MYSSKLFFSCEHGVSFLVWIRAPLRLSLQLLLKSNNGACENNDQWNELQALIPICLSENTACHCRPKTASIALGKDTEAGLRRSCENGLNCMRINQTIQVFQCRGGSVPEDTRGICNGSASNDSGFQDDPNTPYVQFLWLISLVEASAVVPCSTSDSPPRVRRWWVLPEASDLLIHQYNLCVRPS